MCDVNWCDEGVFQSHWCELEGVTATTAAPVQQQCSTSATSSRYVFLIQGQSVSFLLRDSLWFFDSGTLHAGHAVLQCP